MIHTDLQHRSSSLAVELSAVVSRTWLYLWRILVTIRRTAKALASAGPSTATQAKLNQILYSVRKG